MHKKIRILHLEDDPVFASLVKLMLEDHGMDCDIVLADDKASFLEAVQGDKDFELILSDFSLPSFDGISAMNLCRQKHSDVPFIFLSGSMGEELAIDCLKRGASDYVLKSGMSRLVPTVTRALETAQEARAYRQVRETHRRDQFNLRALLDNTSDAIFSVDTSFHVLAFNSPASLLAKKLSGDFLGFGRDFLSPLPTSEQDWWKAAMAKVRNRERFMLEREVQWVKGTEFHEVSFSPIVADNTVTGMAVFSRDVTERDQNRKDLLNAKKQAEDANRAKGQFLANMSHEIRTPMNGVVGMTNLLAETALVPKQRHYVEVIQASAHSLLTIINDILDFSKIEEGKLRLERQAFNFQETITDAMALMESSAHEKGLELKVSSQIRTPLWVLGDSGRIRQILVNLLGNAIKFTNQGFVELRVRSEAEEWGRVRLGCEVEDTGEGISEEAGRNLFQAFSQSDQSDTRRFGGTGLGLAISRQLAHLMGGEIGFTSRPGRGSIFQFSVCLEGAKDAPVDGDGDVKSVLAVLAGRSPLRSLGILVAEDNHINQLVIAGLLENLGQKADMVANGKEAYEACQRRDYDLIFMDCQMPEMDGYEATAKIRGISGRSGTRPWIAAMTGDALKGTREKCLEAGMNGYITKPIMPEILWEELEKASSGNGAPQTGASWKPVREISAGHSEVDRRIVNRLRSISRGEGEFEGLIAEFLRQSTHKTSELEGLLEKREWIALSRAAHAFKGLCLNFGAMAAAKECESLQREAESNRFDGLAGILENVRKSMEKTAGILMLEAKEESLG